jgi:hypothetical protein
VDADPHPQRLVAGGDRRDRVADRPRGAQRARGARKHDHEPVTERLHLETALVGHGGTDGRVVAADDLHPASIAEALTEAGSTPRCR